MTQSEVRALIELVRNSVAAAYWVATDAGVREQLMSLATSLADVLTKLNQSDLESRTEDFTTAAETMSTRVLPSDKQLDASVETLIQVEGAVKEALSDAMKLSQSVSFFKIPAVF